MTPAEFVAKWSAHELKERAACQEHFLDLCRLLGHPTPAESDPKGERFCFERGASKQSGGDGFADVWKKGHFGWEYKGPRADLEAAYQQLLQYREALDNPPLLVVSDTQRVVVHTNFTNTVKQTFDLALDQLDQPGNLTVLRQVFFEPEALRPGISPEKVTEEAAGRVAALAQRLRDRGIEARQAAHFLMKLVFCLFAEDIGLLPKGLFSRILSATATDPARFDGIVGELFRAMATGGWLFLDPIEHFNGGLFDDAFTVPLTGLEIRELSEAARLDWSQVEPAVFGTLFERSLDPAKRAQLGAHYTSRRDIERIIEPVLMQPLRREWETIRAECEKIAAEAATVAGQARRNRLKTLDQKVAGSMDKLAAVRVLDPACGSGNFLYVALTALKDLEKEVIRSTARWHANVPFPRVGPEQLHGIEIDPYAAELAQLTVWIGYLQWMHFNGFGQPETPILKPLETIEQKDAILGLDRDGGLYKPPWPKTDVIVGNPPFLGDKKMRGDLGDQYVGRLRTLYAGQVPSGADLCCYWFERARDAVGQGRARRAGLLATNSVRYGRNREVLERIHEQGSLFMAWSDEPWILDGAAVRISLVGFGEHDADELCLDGVSVSHINVDLTARPEFKRAKPLMANKGWTSFGLNQAGPFDLDETTALALRGLPLNPNGRPNSDVVKRYANGRVLMQRLPLRWVVDFFPMSERDASLYEAPFEYIRQHVMPVRARNRDKGLRERWWLHQRPRPTLHERLRDLHRYLVTPEVTKHRVFCWLPSDVLPDHQLLAVLCEDDYWMGVLHSRVHASWTTGQCSWLGVGNDVRYTPTTCFETFPFPDCGEAERAAVGAAAKALHETRQSALENDPKLTLTALYNKRPTWLDHLHRDLDRAVMAAYGWPEELTDDALLERLLALNLERAADEERGILVRP